MVLTHRSCKKKWAKSREIQAWRSKTLNKNLKGSWLDKLSENNYTYNRPSADARQRSKNPTWQALKNTPTAPKKPITIVQDRHGREKEEVKTTRVQFRCRGEQKDVKSKYYRSVTHFKRIEQNQNSGPRANAKNLSKSHSTSGPAQTQDISQNYYNTGLPKTPENPKKSY